MVKEDDRFNLLKTLYKSVSMPVLMAVYKKYKLDYDLFGYDFKNVIKLRNS